MEDEFEIKLMVGSTYYPLKIKRNGYMPILNSKVYFDEDVLKELQTTII